MNTIARILRIIGYIWIILACIVIIAGYAGIVYQHGFYHLIEILSPFNIWNVIAVILILAPGLILIGISNFLHDRANN